MTRRANPKPRWARYEDKDGNYVNERADDKLKRWHAHRETVKAQQAEGLERQAVRNRLKVREKTREIVPPDVTNFGPPRRRPGRKAKRTTPAKAIYSPDYRSAKNYAHGRRAQSLAAYMKPTYAGVSAGRRP